MNNIKTGKLIYKIRTKSGLTQKQLAEKLFLSDKAISKWETGQGSPDISVIPKLAEVLGVGIEDILSGEIVENQKEVGNMKNLKFYVCPSCGNTLYATSEASINCCANRLEPLIGKKVDDNHRLSIEQIESELYVTMDHEMEKSHFISFVAYVTGDKVFISKQYPEWNMQFRFQKFGRGIMYFYCTNHELYYQYI